MLKSFLNYGIKLNLSNFHIEENRMLAMDYCERETPTKSTGNENKIVLKP